LNAQAVTHRDRRNAELLQSAMAAHRAGRLDAARIHYERVLARNPRDPNALHFHGVLQHNLGRSPEGIASIRLSLELAPANPSAWLNLGNILLQQERCDAAKHAYERAADLEPDMADAWYNLGICLRKMEDAPAAVRALDRALRLRPTHAPSAYQRGIARRDAGELAAAEADFRRALELKCDYFEVFESLGMLLYRQDRIAEAAEVYRAWLARDPSSSTAAHLAAATSQEAVPPRGSDAYVIETFDRFAPTFDQNLANLCYRAPQLVVSALDSVVGERHGFEHVLDVGCGTGLCGALLRPLARHLMGVDLSPAMIECARAKGFYDELCVAELCAFMDRSTHKFDAIVSADTFVYLGELESAFTAAARCLNPSGILVLTLEEMPGGARDYRLEPHGRYSHRLEYVARALAHAGLTLIRSDTDVLRRERGADVHGLVVMAQRR